MLQKPILLVLIRLYTVNPFILAFFLLLNSPTPSTSTLEMIQTTSLDHITLNQNLLAYLPDLQPTFIGIQSSRLFDRINEQHPEQRSLSIHTDSNTENDNIDWDSVAKQLEMKLQTSCSITKTQTEQNTNDKSSNDSGSQSLLTNCECTVKRKTRLNENENISSIEMTNVNIDDRKSLSNQKSTLRELCCQLMICQQKQISLLQQIQHLIGQSNEISSPKLSNVSSKYFLPLNTNEKNVHSLQDAFQQRKSSFIYHSQERVNQICQHEKKSSRHIISNIKKTNNTYLREKRKVENDRLCSMIIKRQNRENAKAYGNLIKNSILS